MCKYSSCQLIYTARIDGRIRSENWNTTTNNIAYENEYQELVLDVACGYVLLFLLGIKK